MNEHILCNAIIEHLNYHGCFCWRVNAGLIPQESNGKKRMIRLAKAGTSDIHGIRRLDGRMICLEVKMPNRANTATDLQREYLEKMKNYGAITGVVTSEDEALEIIRRAEELSRD